MMAGYSDRPGIFALSNPTTKAECSAQQSYEWSGGRAIFASGSPFDPVEYDGAVFHPGQGNNSYIFPGVGLGMIACQANTIPDSVFLQSARALASSVNEADLKRGSIYPPLDQIRQVSLKIAIAVAAYAWDHGLTGQPRPDDIENFIKSAMYDPNY